MRAVLAAAVLVLLTAPAAPMGLAGHSPATTRIHQGPCEEQFVAYPIPMVEAEPLTPPGFPPLTFDAAGLLPPNPLLATVVTVGYRCSATTGDGGLSLGEVRTVGRALVVDPPAALRAPHIVNYVIVFGGWTSSPELGAVYRSWHLPNVEDGTVDFSVTADSANLRHGRVTGSSALGTLDLLTVTLGVEEAQQPDIFRLFVFDQGQVAGYVDWGWPAGSRTIESGAALQLLTAPGAAPDADVGVAFHYFGAYQYDIGYTALP